MPFIPVTNVARVVLQGEQQAQIVQNVFHVYGSIGWDATSLGGLLDDIEGWVDVNLKTVASSNVVYTQAKATDLTTSTGVSVEHFFTPAIVGTHGPLQEPMNVTVAVGWRTGIPGRSFRGRTYHIGLITADSSSSVLGLTPATNIVAAYGALLTILAGGYGVLVVASLYTGGAARLSGLVTPITEVVLNRVLDSQRRRLPERGR